MNLIKRNYKFTPSKYGFKVEIWDDYGCKRTIYETDLFEACDKVQEYWNSQESRKESMKIHQNTMYKLYEKNNNPD